MNAETNVVQQSFVFPTANDAIRICGKNDENLILIEKQLGVKLVPRGTDLYLMGSEEAVSHVLLLLDRLRLLHPEEQYLSERDTEYAIQLVQSGQGELLERLRDEAVVHTSRGKAIRPKTLGQQAYLEAIRNNILVFGVGPAGTGKTYLAVAAAVNALRNRLVSRIILTRPAVEAGEKLGFLPGDLQEKVDPYLRPLYDALHDMLGPEGCLRYTERGMIEIAPLAYMRGRTLDEAFVILDEAQNTTPEQMKMFLTRLGFGSRVVVTGDLTQVDLGTSRISGLAHARTILTGVSGIQFCYLSEQDVVRHELVRRIVQAYEQASGKTNTGE